MGTVILLHSICPAWNGLTPNETTACTCWVVPDITDTVLESVLATYIISSSWSMAMSPGSSPIVMFAIILWLSPSIIDTASECRIDTWNNYWLDHSSPM